MTTTRKNHKAQIPENHDIVLLWTKDKAKHLARCMTKKGIQLFGAIMRGIQGRKDRRRNSLAWWSQKDELWVINDAVQLFDLIIDRGMIPVEVSNYDFYNRVYEEFDEYSD